MKKILTLLIAAGAFVAVNAQTSRDEARRIILGDGGNSGGNNSSTKGRDVILGGGNGGNDTRTYPNSYPGRGSRQAQIDQINREYDAKIYSIRTNSHLSEAEKERAIRQLENDRDRRIREINRSSNSQGHKNGKNNGNCNDDRHDNGKHKGWTKGKGNQKKNKHSGYDD